MAGMGLIQIAFVAFSLISALFLRRQDTPISTLEYQTTSRGTPLPILYGTRVLTGNIIWAGPFSGQAQQGKGGGKGGGGKGQQSDFFASFAIAVCEGPVDCLLNVSEDKTKIDLTQRPDITFYKGTGTQPVDPTIAASVGGSFASGAISRNESFAASSVHNTTYQILNGPVRTGVDVYYLVPTGNGALQYVQMTEVAGVPGPNQWSIGATHEVYQTTGSDGNATGADSDNDGGTPDGDADDDLGFADYNGTVITVGTTSVDGAIVYVDYLQDVSNGQGLSAFADAPAYPYVCYAVFDHTNLGPTPRVKNYRFEVKRTLATQFTGGSAVVVSPDAAGPVTDQRFSADGVTFADMVSTPHGEDPVQMATDTDWYMMKEGLVDGDSSQVWRSQDGGNTWATFGSPVTPGPNEVGRKVFQRLNDGTLMWAVADEVAGGAYVWVSTDNGVTWSKKSISGTDGSYILRWTTCAKDPVNGYAYFVLNQFWNFGGNSGLAVTSDYGQTWTFKNVFHNPDGTTGVDSVFVSRTGTVLAQNYSNGPVAVFRSTDHGTTWATVTTGPQNNGEAPNANLTVKSKCRFGQVASTGRIIWSGVQKSDDDGATWSATGTLLIPQDNTQGPVCMGQNIHRVYAQVWQGVVRYTDDGGATWNAIPTYSGAPGTQAVSWDAVPLTPVGTCVAADENASDIVKDLLTHSRYGAGIDQSLVNVSLFDQSHAYWDTNGILLSPIFKDRKTVLAHVEGLLVLCDGMLVQSQQDIKLIARGMTQTVYPVTTATYLRAGGGPSAEVGTRSRRSGSGMVSKHQLTRQGSNEIINRVLVRYSRRNDEYTLDSEEWKDDWVASRLEGQELDVAGEACCDPVLARRIAQRIMWTRSYNRVQAKIPAGPQDQDKEPGDLLSWTDPVFGVKDRLMRLMTTSRGKDMSIQWDLIEENPIILGWTGAYNAGDSPNVQAIQPTAPLTHTVLVVTEMQPPSVNGNPSIVAAMGGVDASWAGGRLYVSDDGSVYARVFTTTASSTVGTCQTAMPDSPVVEDSDEHYQVDLESTVTVKLITINDQLNSVTDAQWRSGVNRMLIDQEVVYWQNATMVSTGVYRLSNFYRGSEGTMHAAHTTNSTVLFFDPTVVVLTPVVGGPPLLGIQQLETVVIPWPYVGKTLYFKATSINIAGFEQDISLVEPTVITYKAAGGLPMPPADLEVVGYDENDFVVDVPAHPNADLALEWTYVSPAIFPDEELVGTTLPGHDLKFDHYRLEVWYGGVRVRLVDNLLTESFVYTEAMNVADNGSWKNTLTVKVFTVNNDGGVSPVEQATFTMVHA